MIALSIDWDYFIPEDPMLDMGHNETALFMQHIWDIRAASFLSRGIDYKEQIKTNGKEKTFWEAISKIFDISNANCILTESHVSMYYLASGAKITEIYSFDAHADLSYGNLGEKIDYGNWLGSLVIESILKRGYIVLSDESNEKQSDYQKLFRDKRFQDTIRFINLNDIKNQPKKEIKIVHICRSGAWCPSWLDNAFFEFVKSSGLSYSNAGLVERRWDKTIEKRIEKEAENERKFLYPIKQK